MVIMKNLIYGLIVSLIFFIFLAFWLINIKNNMVVSMDKSNVKYYINQKEVDEKTFMNFKANLNIDKKVIGEKEHTDGYITIYRKSVNLKDNKVYLYGEEQRRHGITKYTISLVDNK